MKQSIKPEIWKIRKQNSHIEIRTGDRKNNLKNLRIACGASGITSSIPTFTRHGYWKGNREQRIENLCEQMMTDNLPNLVKKKAYKSRKHKESQIK